jgi:hypothetical protein
LLDVAGALDRERVRAALAATMAANPATVASVRYARLSARAYWKCAADTDGAFGADQVPLSYHDLRGDPAPEHTQREILVRACRERHDPSATRQIRLLHLRLRDDAHRLVLRWPHYLMDLQGGMMFLKAVGDVRIGTRSPATGGAPPPFQPAPAVHPDEYPPNWSRHYIRRLIQGLRAWRRHGRIPTATLKPEFPITDANDAHGEVLHRHWPASAIGEIDVAIRSTCAPGPFRYTRYFMIALLRALDDLHDDLGWCGEKYVLPLPMLRPRRGPRTAITRNDLTIATLVVDRRLVSRSDDLDAALGEQIDAYSRCGLDEATWVAMSCAGWLRMRQYRWLMSHGGLTPYSSGFASFRADAEWEDFLGARVENFSACPLPTIPPGLMTSFCRFGDRLNLGVGFYPHLCPPRLAQRLIDHVECHLGISVSPRYAQLA